MKALVFQTVTRSTPMPNGRRRSIDISKIYAIPESVTILSTTTRLLSDSLLFTDVAASVYSMPENSWRNDSIHSADWRKYQTMLNRSRRSVGIHGAAYIDLMGEVPTIEAGTTMPTGTVKSFTETGYLSLVENDIDTQNEWDEGDLSVPSGTMQAGVLVRLARNNAVFFIPDDHLARYEVLSTDSTRKAIAAKSLFGHKPKTGSGSNKRIATSPRFIGVKNIFRGIGDIKPVILPTGETNPTAPTGAINSFTDNGKILDLMEELRDLDDDVMNDTD